MQGMTTICKSNYLRVGNLFLHIVIIPDFDTKLVFVQKNINNINESVLGFAKV